jgi:hypothetical protein
MSSGNQAIRNLARFVLYFVAWLRRGIEQPVSDFNSAASRQCRVVARALSRAFGPAGQPLLPRAY